MTHKQQVKKLDEVKKGKDTLENPEFIKFVKTKADGQEILCMSGIQQGGELEIKKQQIKDTSYCIE